MITQVRSSMIVVYLYLGVCLVMMIASWVNDVRQGRNDWDFENDEEIDF